MKEIIVTLAWLAVFIADVIGIVISVADYFKLPPSEKWIARLMFLISVGGAAAILVGIWRVFG